MATAVSVAERAEFQKGLRAFLIARSPLREVRRVMTSDLGHDPAVWDALTDQLGVPGIHVPETLGGSGLGHAEVAAVFEELGRTLTPAPLLGTVALAANTLLCCGDEAAQAEHLPGIAAGRMLAVVAVVEADGRWEPDAVATTATPDGAHHRLNGSKGFVVDGLAADLLLVAAKTAEGVSLFAVAGDADGLARAPMQTMDLTRRLAWVSFEDAPAELVGESGAAASVLERTLDLACLALAAEQVGAAQAVLDMSIAYACDRVQFGRAIGSFQAIKHKCADVHVAVESARSAVRHAVELADGDARELSVAASLAKAWCSDAFLKAASEAIQVHGAIGFTWEHDAHLYFKRATCARQTLGDPAWHRERMARRLGW